MGKRTGAETPGNRGMKSRACALAGIVRVCGVQLTLEVPDSIQQAMRVPEAERRSRLLLELACALYERNILTFGKAAELADLGQFRFGHELAAREIARHCAEEDLAEDLAYGCGQ